MIFGSSPFGASPLGGLISPTAEAFVDINLAAISTGIGGVSTSQILDRNVTGNQSAVVLGSITVTQQVDKALTGILSTVQIGDEVNTQTLDRLLSGVQITSAIDNLLVDISLTLTSVSSTISVDSVTNNSAVSIQLAPNVATVSTGVNQSSQIVDYTISGVSLTSAIGTLISSQDVNISLVNNAATGSLGNLSPPEFTLAIPVSVQSTLTVGSINATQTIDIGLGGISSLVVTGGVVGTSVVSIQLVSNETVSSLDDIIKEIWLSISGLESTVCPDTAYDINYFAEDYVVTTNLVSAQSVAIGLTSTQITTSVGSLVTSSELLAQVSGVNSVSAVGSAVVTNVVYIDIAGSEALSFVDNLDKIISFGIIGSEVSGVVNSVTSSTELSISISGVNTISFINSVAEFEDAILQLSNVVTTVSSNGISTYSNVDIALSNNISNILLSNVTSFVDILAKIGVGTYSPDYFLEDYNESILPIQTDIGSLDAVTTSETLLTGIQLIPFIGNTVTSADVSIELISNQTQSDINSVINFADVSISINTDYDVDYFLEDYIGSDSIYGSVNSVINSIAVDTSINTVLLETNINSLVVTSAVNINLNGNELTISTGISTAVSDITVILSGNSSNIFVYNLYEFEDAVSELAGNVAATNISDILTSSEVFVAILNNYAEDYFLENYTQVFESIYTNIGSIGISTSSTSNLSGNISNINSGIVSNYSDVDYTVGGVEAQSNIDIVLTNSNVNIPLSSEYSEDYFLEEYSSNPVIITAVDNVLLELYIPISSNTIISNINTFGIIREEVRSISGNTIGSSTDNITTQITINLALSGNISTSGTGSVSLDSDIILSLYGIELVQLLGNLTKSFDTTVNLTGVEAVIYTGIETPESGFDKQLTSVVSNVNISSVSATTAISFGIIGNSASGTPGSLNQQFIILQLSPLTEIFGSIANTTNTVYDLRDMPTHLIVDAPSMSEEMGVILLNNNDSDIVTY